MNSAGEDGYDENALYIYSTQGGSLTVTGAGGSGVSRSSGVYVAQRDLRINGCTVTATGGAVTDSAGISSGISVQDGDFIISPINDSTVVARGGDGAYSYGIEASGAITIGNTDLTAAGASRAIWSDASGSVSVSPPDGMAIAVTAGDSVDGTGAAALEDSPFNNVANVTERIGNAKYFHSTVVDSPNDPSIEVGSVTLYGTRSNIDYAITNDNGDVTTDGAGPDHYTIMWDGETLTLEGAKISADSTQSRQGAVYYDGDLKIELSGENTVSGAHFNLGAPSGFIGNYGIYVSGDVEISGDGTLHSTGGNTDVADGNTDVADGIGVQSTGIYVGGDLEIKSGTIHSTGGRAHITSGEGSAFSYGIHAVGCMTVSGGAVYATGSEASTVDANGSTSSFGIYAAGGLNIEGAVTAEGVNKAIEGSVTITQPGGGLVIVAEAGDSADGAADIAIPANGEITGLISGARYFHSAVLSGPDPEPPVGPNLYVGGVGLNGSADEPDYAVNDGYGNVTTANADENHYNVRWDGATLTLKDATISEAYQFGDENESAAAIYCESELAIVLEGTNTVTAPNSGADTVFANSYGIYAHGSGDLTELTISGSGSLNASGGEVNANSYGIYSDMVTIESGTVMAAGGRSESMGVSAGIYSADLTINGGNVFAIVGRTSGEGAFGILAAGDVTVTGGTVRAMGSDIYIVDGVAPEYSSGIHSIGGDVTITGGAVQANGGAVEKYEGCQSYGVSAQSDGDEGGNIIISGGSFEAAGFTNGIYGNLIASPARDGQIEMSTYDQFVYPSEEDPVDWEAMSAAAVTIDGSPFTTQTTVDKASVEGKLYFKSTGTTVAPDPDPDPDPDWPWNPGENPGGNPGEDSGENSGENTGDGAGTHYCTLTFESRGGSELEELRVPVGTTVELDEYLSERFGFDFAGWYPDERFVESIDDIYMDRDKTIYAGWEPFDDAESADWFYAYVVYVYENGLMNGVSDTLFDPNGTVTRAQLVTILWRLDGEPAVNYALPFDDVASGAWYAEAVRWASRALSTV